MIDLKCAEIAFALDVVRQASELVRYIQDKMVTPALTKDDRSPVTVADFASQALVGYWMKKIFPGDPLVGEEGSLALQTTEERKTLEAVTTFVAEFIPEASPQRVCEWIDHGAAEPARRFWTVDPIDGTKGFLRGDQYVVALALIEDARVQIGVLGCPRLPLRRLVSLPEDEKMSEAGCLVVAARGQGTWATPLDQADQFVRLQTSLCTDPALARLLSSVEADHTDHDKIAGFIRAMGIQIQAVRMDSQAKYALLAAGQGELLLRLLSPRRPDYHEMIWDQAAGSIVVEEAGGQVTDLHGMQFDFSQGRTLARNRGVLASNGHLHEVALKTLRQV